jgi:hypothetical protein
VSEIGDEIRRRFDVSSDSEGVIFDRDGCNKMRELADRIDAEMVELPKDSDGKPIRVGDTVYACDDPSLEYEVSYIEYRRDVTTIGMDAPGIQTYRRPVLITHERNDSWERIADELDEFRKDSANSCVICADGEDTLHNLAERIRKLAKVDERS